MIIKLRPILIGLLLVLLMGIGVWKLAAWNNTTKEEVALPQVMAVKNSPTVSEQSFFPSFRLQREKVRSQQLELLKEIVNNPNTDDKSKQAALSRLLSITNSMEMELKAEGLLRAQGFKEGVVILQEDTASVIISSAPLDENQEMQVKSGLAGVLKLNSQQINIINRK